MILRTERLVLRIPSEDDIDDIRRACQDPELQRRVPIPVPYTRETAESFVRQHVADGWASGRSLTWAIDRDGVFAGVVGIDVSEGRRGSIGYWLAPSMRRAGIMREAARVAVDFALGESSSGLGLLRLEWRAFAGNTASARTAQHLGFRFEGTARLAAVGRDGLEDEWRAARLSTDDPDPRAWPVMAS